MEKTEMKVVICVLGMLFSLGVFQMEAIGKKPMYQILRSVPMYQKKLEKPDVAVTIVLRAPTSNHPYLVTSSETQGKEIFKGLAVSLPRYTPIFLSVDLVNTALYTVTINEETPDTASESERYTEYSLDGALDLIKKAREKFETQEPKKARKNRKTRRSEKAKENLTKSLLDSLARKVEAAHVLNKKLDTLLEATEKPQFYNNRDATEIRAAFFKIADAAEEAAKNLLKLQAGTAQELCEVTEAAMQKVYRSYKGNGENVLKDIPKDLSDPKNQIAAVFLAAAGRLRAIETATWNKNSHRRHILNNQVKYKCVFTPRVAGRKLREKRLEVTVTPTIGLSGVQFTVGSFMTPLHDDRYISDKNERVALGAQDRINMPLGALAHIPICGTDFSRFSSALALSTGFAIGTASTHGQLVVDGQAVLGGSLLFSGPMGGGDMFAVTFGGIVKPVRRLNGYWVGDPFPQDSAELTRPVYRISWFLGLTANFKFLPKIFGFGKDDSSKQK